jgi:uncharacterized membrane protein
VVWTWIGSEAPALKRLMGSAVVGLVALVAVVAFAPWQFDILVLWDGFAATFLITVWVDIVRFDSARTASSATREDETRGMARIILLGASTTSLVGVGVALLKGTQEGGTAQIVLSSLAVLTVVLSWAVVHTDYTLRYARLYYGETPGGINFHGDAGDAPDYRDFAYVAFTVGMTYQVSDTDLGDRGIRRTALAHALLSFLFGSVIIATLINIVASFVN